MNTFRAFILDENNRIVRAEVLAVTNDDEALAAAIALSAENGLEIWQGSRRIATVDKDGAIIPGGKKDSSPAP